MLGHHRPYSPKSAVGKSTAPRAWCHTDDPAKHSGEVRLIEQAALEGDLGQGGARARHEHLAVLDPSLCDIGEWGFAKASAKGAEEVTGT